jgi:peptidoglycan/LPS O-acetylase OafA/YrhL
MRTADRWPGFRPDIEGLRGIAILLVVFFHCGLPGFSGGFVGVDVFFVLSGFLITGLLVKEIKETSRLDLLRFYARRARRLLPASALTLVATLLIGAMILAPHELDNTGRASRAAALYASNIFFDKNAGDYFAADVKSNPMLHTWSLAVEEQFYFFWPLLVSLSVVWWRSEHGSLD